MEVKLSAAERLILANQYRIRAKLEGDESLVSLANQLEAGHSTLYSLALGHIFDEVISRDQEEFVWRALELFDHLRIAHEGLDSASPVADDDIAFMGFGGNEESEYLSLLRAIVEGGQYEYLITPALKARNLNAHMATVPVYGRMLAEWRARGEPRADKLSADDIAAIVKARIHPDSR